MPRSRLIMVTASIMLGLALAAIEATVVSTAMPTIISQLGGLAEYGWVFSVYALTSAVMTPIFGKLSDLYGRRPVFLAGMAIFLVGSALSGLSQSMNQLIIFRAIQGVGAGALIPLSFTIAGDIFTVEERTRVQGLFSGVWGVASLVGPVIGGLLVQYASWRWVFYVNIPLGLLAMGMVWFGLTEPAAHRGRVQIDYLGALTLSLSVVALLLAVMEGGNLWPWASPQTALLLLVAVASLLVFVRIERRAPEPLIPLSLFHDRVFNVAASQGFLTGFALFGSSAFIPLFAQAVLGKTPAEAGLILTPQIIGWVIASTAGAPFILRVGYRPVLLAGMTAMTIGSFMMARLSMDTTVPYLIFAQFLAGAGMGISVTALLIAAQNRVTRSRMGATTSTLTFSRSLGGTIGVSIMGAVLAALLLGGMQSHGGGLSVTPEQLLDPIASKLIPPTALEPLREILVLAIQPVFVIAAVATALGLVVSFFMPPGSVRELATEPTGVELAAPLE
ncbi:MAG: MDR family MFS transporter [Anaerolineae bacterium]